MLPDEREKISETFRSEGQREREIKNKNKKKTFRREVEESMEIESRERSERNK